MGQTCFFELMRVTLAKRGCDEIRNRHGQMIAMAVNVHPDEGGCPQYVFNVNSRTNFLALHNWRLLRDRMLSDRSVCVWRSYVV